LAVPNSSDALVIQEVLAHYPRGTQIFRVDYQSDFPELRASLLIIGNTTSFQEPSIDYFMLLALGEAQAPSSHQWFLKQLFFAFGWMFVEVPR
jgi:hypothetical protein